MSNKLKIILTASLLFSFLVITMYFNKEQKAVAASNVQKIEAPFPEGDIPMDSYMISPDSSASIKRITGTRIRIEPGTFKKKDGSEVTGKVELKVREFHKAADILRAGIPMRINAGSENFLQSAGMIEMRAYSGSEEVEIKEGKGIDVDLAGFRSSEGYDLYYLKNDAEWVIPGNFSAGNNTEKKKRLEEISKLPSEPAFRDSLLENRMVFSLAGNFFLSPQLKTFANRQWALVGNNDEEEVRRALRINWDKVNVQEIDKEKMIHEMVFSRVMSVADGQGILQEIRFQAVPVMNECDGKEDRSLFESELKEYKAMMQKVEEEEKRLAGEADLLNSFRMNKLGICNIDRIMEMNAIPIASVSFDFDLIRDKHFTRDMRIFLLLPDKNSVVEMNDSDRNRLVLFPGEKTEIVAYVSADQVAVVDNDQIQEVCRARKKDVYFNTRRYKAGEYLGVKS